MLRRFMSGSGPRTSQVPSSKGEAVQSMSDNDLNAILDMSAKFGMGFGAGFTLHTWELIDTLSTIVGFGYWSLDGD